MNPEARSTMYTRARMALLLVAGWITYVAVDNAVEATYRSSLGQFVVNTVLALADNSPAESDAAQRAAEAVSVPAMLPFAASLRAEPGVTVFPQQLPQKIPQEVYVGPLAGAADPNAGAAQKSRRPQSTISNAATPVIEQPENAISLLGPVVRESGRRAVVVPPFLVCTVEILEHGVLVSRQTIGCTQSDNGERPSMLMEFGQEVPNEIPNMMYWLSVQVDGYRKGYPILRTRMELKGLLGRAVGRRKYESVTIVEPNKKHVVIAFNIDDDDFAVTVVAKKQE